MAGRKVSYIRTNSPKVAGNLTAAPELNGSLLSKSARRITMIAKLRESSLESKSLSSSVRDASVLPCSRAPLTCLYCLNTGSWRLGGGA
jgi:hypothetical protein